MAILEKIFSKSAEFVKEQIYFAKLKKQLTETMDSIKADEDRKSRAKRLKDFLK